MSDPDWEIPLNLQPEPSEYRFDLDSALRSVVALRANVPADAFTAESLGTERIGSGVVIRVPGAPEGLVLTIGYLITEAETIWLVSHDGRAVAGHALAYDQATGFGLVLTLGKLGVPGIELGRSAGVGVGDQLVMAAGGGLARAMETRLVGRQEFAGYWEYLLDEALFIAPAHPFWSGAAVLDAAGKLVGIGSLILQQGDDNGQRADMNMAVPIDLLHPILTSMLTTGSSGRPPHPWLGVFVMENEGGLVIGGLAEDGPAERAGVQVGDEVVGLGDEEISDVAALWRQLWAAGAPGVEVKLHIKRGANTLTVRIATGDRNKALRSPSMH
ncbi:MAG: S1C family serine protease [Acetobacteraceae bacterium]|nr:S1C family serine protease [Acetobacteraceae bacterium]